MIGPLHITFLVLLLATPAHAGHRSFNRFGAGCAGSGNIVPDVAVTGEALIGNASFALRCERAFGGTLNILYFGTSNSSYSGLPLPASLAGLGAPGCFLRVAPDVFIRAVVSSGAGPGQGSAMLALPIPNAPELDGLRLFFQWFPMDPGANAFGFSSTPGGELTIRADRR